MRPNQKRTKMSIFLSQVDRGRIEEIKTQQNIKTTAAALRYALEAAIANPIDKIESDNWGIAVLKWAMGLQFVTPNEARQRNELIYDAYERAKEQGVLQYQNLRKELQSGD